MKEKYNKLTIELNEYLINHTKNFLEENLDDEEGLDNVLNLILSGTLSCMVSLMTMISRQDKEIKENIGTFLAQLVSHIQKTIPNGGKMEILSK
jgi:hypothetical protein